MTRFHLAPGAVQGDRVTFDAAAAHHLGRVLRAAVGDLVQAVDPHGELLSVRLTAIAPRRAEGLVTARARLDTESPLRLTLAQAVPKGDKMEGIVRMTTELGVSRLIPLLTERTVVRLPPDRWAARLVTAGGQLVLGGMLEDEDDRVSQALAISGFERRSRLALEGWASLRLAAPTR